jgi:membrane protease YdiL (CAAX protease family)
MNTANDFPAAVIPPVIPPAAEKRVWGAWPSFGFTLVILAIFFVVQSIVIIIPALVSLFSNVSGSIGSPEDLTKLVLDELNSRLGLWQAIATIVSGVIGTVMIWVFIRAKKGAGFKEYLGLNKISLKTGLAVAGITIAYIGLADLAQWLLGVGTSETVMNQIFDTSVFPPLLWISVIIFAPLFEEALFRGFFFEGLRQSWWGVYGAIMLTAFGWSILHGAQYSVSGIIYIFLLGVIIGVVRWKTKTIWSAFIMHAVMNLLATIAMVTNANF